jgi:hypothetical protein
MPVGVLKNYDIFSIFLVVRMLGSSPLAVRTGFPLEHHEKEPGLTHLPIHPAGQDTDARGVSKRIGKNRRSAVLDRRSREILIFARANLSLRMKGYKKVTDT